MHTAAALLLFAMVFGVDEPEPEPGSGGRRVCSAKAALGQEGRAKPAPRAGAGLAAELQAGKLVVSRTTVARGVERVERVILHELTSDRFAWEWARSEDGGRTWVTLYETAFSRDDRPA